VPHVRKLRLRTGSALLASSCVSCLPFQALSLSSALADMVASGGPEVAPTAETALQELSSWAASFEGPRELSEQFEEAAAARAAKAKFEEGSNRVYSRPSASAQEGVNADGEWSRSLEGWVSFKEEGGIHIEQRPQDQAWSERVPWQYSADIVWPPAPKPSLKRKAESDANDQAKKQKAGQSAAQAAAATLASRKDHFRARRQNTGRPPSMHVDDFMAQKGKGVAVPAQSTAARIHTGGRAPSIRVDDFMKLESEKGRTVVGAPVQPASEGGSVPLVTSAATKPTPPVIRAATAAVVRTAGQAAVVKQPARVLPPQAPPAAVKTEPRPAAAPPRPPAAPAAPPTKAAQPPPAQQQARAPLPTTPRSEVRPAIQSVHTTLSAPTPAAPVAKPPPAAWPKPLHEIAQAADRQQIEKTPPLRPPQPAPAQAPAPAPPQRQPSFTDPRRQEQAAAPPAAPVRAPQPPSNDPRRAPAAQSSLDPRRSAPSQPDAGSAPGGDPRRPPIPPSSPLETRRPGQPPEMVSHDPRRPAQGAPMLPTADPRRRADPRLMGRGDSFGPAVSPPVPESPGWQKQPSPGGGLPAQRGPPGPPQAYGQSPPAPRLLSPAVPNPQAWNAPQQQAPSYGAPQPQHFVPGGPGAQQLRPPGGQASASGQPIQGAQARPSAPGAGPANKTEMIGKLQDILKQPGFIQVNRQASCSSCRGMDSAESSCHDMAALFVLY
jgi:hypothetical protein